MATAIPDSSRLKISCTTPPVFASGALSVRECVRNTEESGCGVGRRAYAPTKPWMKRQMRTVSMSGGQEIGCSEDLLPAGARGKGTNSSLERARGGGSVASAFAAVEGGGEESPRTGSWKMVKSAQETKSAFPLVSALSLPSPLHPKTLTHGRLSKTRSEGRATAGRWRTRV